VRTVALLVALTLGVSGCSALTGRPFIQWTDDKAIHARVKARLILVSLKHLSRIHVDIYDSVVYLSGSVDTPEAKERAEGAAMAVEGVRQVVSNLVAKGEGADDAPAALPSAAVLERPVPAALVGVVRLEGRRAYDRAGRHVATVYTVPMSDLAQSSAERFSATRPVDHVTVHAMSADVHVPTPHYLLVLWHVPEPKAPPYTPSR
jgi:hypothetical protein